MGGNRLRVFLLRLAAAACAVLCLFSAAMTGTYAWESKQAITNDLRGSADIMVSVVLEKLEKGTNSPVAGAEFYLYREDGKQIGGRYVTNALGVICVQLGVGSYYFEEVNPPLGYTFDVDEEGKAVTRYPFTVVAQDMPISVLAYNIRLRGDLIISKTVENSDGTALSEAQKEEVFTFTVAFSDGGTYDYVIGNERKPLVSGETLELRHGESAVFTDLPFGLLYDVTESFTPGYTVSSTGHRGNITDENIAVADFVNICQSGGTGELVVTKTVVGEDLDPETGENRAENEMFTFTATIGGVQEIFTLKHGEQKVFSGIALGTNYTITEQRSEGYVANVEEYAGAIHAAETVTLPFINTFYAGIPVDTGSLTISKKVEGATTAVTANFTFKVEFTGENPPEEQMIVLLDGGTKTIEGIPHGVGYTVTEVVAGEYLPRWREVSGTIVGGKTAVAAFINDAPPEIEPPTGTVTLTVSKVLEGALLSSDYQREFRMTLLADGKAESFTLKHGESREFTVSDGAPYELREENYIAEGFAQSITNGSGIATENTAIVVTNTYVGMPRVEISGKKTWNIPEGISLTLPDSITVCLMDGDKVVEEQTVVPNAEEWLYTFIAPKYRGDGITEIVYTVVETPIDHFHTSYDGYNITNTYVVPITDNDPPIIIKEIAGDYEGVPTFTFLFAGQNGAPMPEGSVGYQKEVSITGGGEVEIGAITFTEAGTYTYTVHEKNGGEKGWTYDTSLYTIVYVVTEDPATHQLTAVRTITKNNIAAEELRFVNGYRAQEQEMVVISGVKTWVHGNNPVKNRPTSVIVEIYGAGKLAYMKSVTAQDDWRYSAELPRYDEDGREIVYRVDEQPVSGYHKSVNGYNITNTYYGGTVPTPPVIPDNPDTPDEPEKPDSSAPTGDDSRIPFWLTMTLASMLGGVAAMRTLRNGQYVGKRLYTGKRLKKK